MLANRSELRSVNNSCFHEASTALGAGDEGAAGEDSRSYLPVSGRTAGSSIVADLNPVLRGWAEYFRNGNSGRKFNAVDGYVHEWLAIFASRKHGLAGRNWATRYTYAWLGRLGVHRLTGNVHWATAHASR